MGRTRDMEFAAAPIPSQTQKPLPTSSKLHFVSIANGLNQALGVCNASLRSIEEHLPDDLKSFDALLGPLIRCNEEIVTALKDWAQASSNDCGRGSDAHRASKFTSKLCSISSSSRIPKGLSMNARELCKIWAGCATGRFQLASFQWFRDAVGARHEYLLFKLESKGTSSHSGKDMWLRLERRPSTPSKRKLMGSLFGQFAAADLITLSPQREDLLCMDDEPLEPQASVVFKDKLSLRYLVDVLDIIHDESLEYHIAGANCWFYASTIAEIVTKKAQTVWELGDISYCDHWKSKNMVNSDQYKRIMNRVRHLREHYS